MIRRATDELAPRGARWMLLLENDWETVKPFPFGIFETIRARGDVYTLRLYGTHKSRDGRRPVGTRHRGRDGADPQWQQFDGYEVGDIHWGNPPAVSNLEIVRELFRGARTEKGAILRSGIIKAHVARVVENVVYHIGEERTPRFVK